MVNKQNLKPIDSVDMAREYQKKSVEARKRNTEEKKNLRLALEVLLEKEFTDKNGNKMTGTEAISAKLFEQAMKGNIRAFETLRDTVGQKPVEKVMMTEISQDVIEEVERAVFDDDDKATGD